jgi:hypothetical protein
MSPNVSDPDLHGNALNFGFPGSGSHKIGKNVNFSTLLLIPYFSAVFYFQQSSNAKIESQIKKEKM